MAVHTVTAYDGWMPETVNANPGAIEDEKETGRTEAFSDGVFAIAITLLILDMKVPRLVDLGHRTLSSALFNQWSAFLAYTISFLTVLIMWINHHKLFRHIRRIDHSFMILNGCLLMMVTFVPFPTALLAEHARGPYARTAAAFYSGTFLVIAIFFQLIWSYASRHKRLLHARHDAGTIIAITRQYRFGPLYYLISFLLAFVNWWASIAACVALAIFFALPGTNENPSRRLT